MNELWWSAVSTSTSTSWDLRANNTISGDTMNYQSKSRFLEVNQPWHIPRASLGSGSSNSSTSANGSQLSHSNTSSVKYDKRNGGGGRRTASAGRRNADDVGGGSGEKNRGYMSDDGEHNHTDQRQGAKAQRHGGRTGGRRSNSTDHYYQQQATAAAAAAAAAADGGAIGMHPNGVGGVVVVKRSSQSSRGSTDSNHSSHSASSGSMLLTAANLEQLAQIHKQNELNQPNQPNMGAAAGKTMLQANVERLTSTYNANITSAAGAAAAGAGAGAADGSPSTIIAMGGADRLKEADTMSLASSTHFTMVNGVGGPQRKLKSGLCDRGHQITVLILTMSAIFLIGICGAVFMLEMRAKKMMSSSMNMHNE